MNNNTAVAAERLFGQVSASPLVVHVAGADAFSINAAAGGFQYYLSCYNLAGRPASRLELSSQRERQVEQ
jgi:hypothetical protein